jgi:hypothetical protein
LPPIEGDRPAHAKADLRHLVHLDLAGRAGAGLKRHSVQRALDAEDAGLGLLRAQLDRDQFPRAQRDVVDPENPGREGPRLVRLVVDGGTNLAALDE